MVREEQTRLSKVLEALVTAAIILVIVQTFMEDFAVITGWSERSLRLLLYCSFGFDLFFTIEFLTRLYNSLSRRKAIHYLVSERGWIDFLAAVPLLILSSGPPVVSLILSGTAVAGMAGFLNILKIIKAIRIARILRLLRVLKIFRNIKYADSRMAQRHLAKIVTISITVIVFSLFGYSLLSEFVDGISPEVSSQDVESRIEAQLEKRVSSPSLMVDAIRLLDERTMLVREGEKTIFTRYSQETYDEDFETGDYLRVASGGWEVYLDWREVSEGRDVRQAWQTLFFFVIVMLILVSYLVIYSPHFAMTVTDPIHVMKKGFEDRDYNLEVKIPESFRTDDVFEMARLYNEVYLPLKDLHQDADDDTNLKLDDIVDILE